MQRYLYPNQIWLQSYLYKNIFKKTDEQFLPRKLCQKTNSKLKRIFK